MTFSKMAARTNAPGTTRKAPKAAKTTPKGFVNVNTAVNAQVAMLTGRIDTLTALVERLLNAPVARVARVARVAVAPVARKTAPVKASTTVKTPAKAVVSPAKVAMLANLARGRAILAAKRAAAKAPAAAAPVARKARKVAPVAVVAAKAPVAKAYTGPISIKLAKVGPGAYAGSFVSAKGATVAVSLTWSGTSRAFIYEVGPFMASATDRGAAVKAINVILAKSGIAAVRA